MLRYLPFLLLIALTVYAFIDCLNTPEEEVKHLQKVVWVLIILLFPIVGAIVWLYSGKKRQASAGRARRTQWVAPDDNPEFLNSLREEQDRTRGRDEEKDAEKDADREKDTDRDRDRDKD
ncbi:PLD nuclease N-terminal domain-containing protein [Streptomyces sp. NBC_00513]|uniref:PLD nuclease N-terminal domain-containing protein n=1 Tax=unclassified Streptomyces TaxID=2593676 RepID=UPI0022555163|nr:PLD nuclease N-terminal domain-containing protein [Streptomyces sp. NBC_00424]MCX5074875.1 PLD nuclease N-terminal domain-containing protein [Streptomyces sp. NBC_00424]WUD41961.1 PLD nuclease N-terminal domain-containing protein [Streptomyces sp. NBC_00513]